MSLCLHTWGRSSHLPFSQRATTKRQENPALCQFSHSVRKGTGQKLFNMLMASVRHNPQTSGTSLHQCPSKIKSLTHSNQYLNYRFKLALFCFTSNPNCFPSRIDPLREGISAPYATAYPRQARPLACPCEHQGTESCRGFASSKPQNNIFNTVELDSFFCWRSL